MLPSPAMLLLLVPDVLACDLQYTRVQLADAMALAEASYAAADVDAFQKSATVVIDAVPCASELLRPPDASRFHRLMGLVAFVARDTESAQRSFAAARAIEPNYTWDPNLVPPGHPLLFAYGAVSASNPELSPFSPPAGVTVHVDGSPAVTRPAAWAAIVQLTDTRDQLTLTRYLRPSDTMPFPAEPLPVKTVAKRPGLRTPLLVGAGVAALAAGALYGASAAVQADYMASTDHREMEELKGTNQALVYTSGGTAGVALATALVAVFATSW